MSINKHFTKVIISVFIILLVLGSAQSYDEYVIHEFERIQLSTTFYGEGAGAGDLNGNGHPDVVCGPYWYEGPTFDQRHAYYEPIEFDPLGYSDNFIVEIDDVNKNGLNDILIVGFPGEEAYWYENPGTQNGYWNRHLIYPKVDNEAQQFVDMTGDGNLDLIFHTGGYLGYASQDPSDPTKPWKFTAISEKGPWYHFTHGMGVGDITGNGYLDFLMNEGWWENPGLNNSTEPWTYHQVNFGRPPAETFEGLDSGDRSFHPFDLGGGQMYAYDVDGDGLNDIITSHDGHGWGLAWYRQIRTDNGIEFEENLIMGENIEDNPYGVRFSQLHAVELSDINQNGRMDIVTGKRWWAHGPDRDPGADEPPVIYWFKHSLDANGSVEYIPYMIDDDSGLGVQFTTKDLTGNGYPDIISCNKRGGSIFLNKPRPVSAEVWEAFQPERIY